MVTFEIDGQTVELEEGEPILKAAEKLETAVLKIL